MGVVDSTGLCLLLRVREEEAEESQAEVCMVGLTWEAPLCLLAKVILQPSFLKLWTAVPYRILTVNDGVMNNVPMY